MSKKNGSNPGDPRVKKNAFVHKLYTMLNDPNLSHLIWWTTNNVEANTFALLPGKEFANCLTRYFKHGNVASFVRQLHMYGFHKVSDPHINSTSNNLHTSYSMNLLHNNANKEAPPIWEFKHSSGKFRKGDEKSLALIKRRSSSNSNTNLRNNSFNENSALHHHNHHQPQHQSIYPQEYSMLNHQQHQQTTYDPYNLNITFQPQPQPHYLYYNQPQQVQSPPPIQKPPPPQQQQQQSQPPPQQLPTPQFIYGQPYFQYPGPAPQSQQQQQQPIEGTILPPPPPSNQQQHSITSSHFSNFSQFPSPQPLRPISLQQTHNTASNTPQIQQPTPQHVENQPQQPQPSGQSQLQQQHGVSPDYMRIDPLSKSPLQNSTLANISSTTTTPTVGGNNSGLQFRKIWDDNNNRTNLNNESSSRQRNPSLLYDPLATIPPQPHTNSIHIQSQKSVKNNEGESRESMLPSPSQINRSISLNQVPTTTTSLLSEPFRRSTTPMLPTISHSPFHPPSYPPQPPSRLSSRIPRKSSPLANSKTSDSSSPVANIIPSTTPNQTHPSPPLPPPVKKPSLFSSSLQERLRPSVFEIYQSSNKSPPMTQRNSINTISENNCIHDKTKTGSIASNTSSIVSNTSSVFSNNSSISSISYGSGNYRAIPLSSVTSCHTSTNENNDEINGSKKLITLNGNVNTDNESSSSSPFGGAEIESGQKSTSGSPSGLKTDLKSKKVSVNSLLKTEEEEEKVSKLNAKYSS